MSDLVSILPGETRKHFINMKNVRDAHERELDAKRLDELNGMAAERRMFHSGWYLEQRSKLRTQFADALAYGYIEEALATCKLYEVPLTPPFCALLEEAAKQMLTSFYRNIIQAGGTGVADFRMPASAVQAVNPQASNKCFSVMPKIAVMIEAARVADKRKRAEDMVNKAAKVPAGNAATYIQHINQSGPGSSVSQLGDTHTNILQISEMSGLKQELAAIRAALKAQPESHEADEVLGSRASAERAAQSTDEHGVKHALSTITKGGWEIVKKVVPTVGSQALLHYLNLHGMA